MINSTTIFYILTFLLFSLNNTVNSFSSNECLSCHEDKGMGSLFVDEKELKGSRHADLGCVDCHSDISGLPHPEKLSPVSCKNCHDSVFESYKKSIHGMEKEKGDRFVASCRNCHGTHNIRSSKDTESSTYAANIPLTCAKCHEEDKVVREKGIPINKPYKFYSESIHGRAVIEKKSNMPPNCSTCHGAHDIYRSNDPQSKSNKNNIPKLCGKCHYGIYQAYIESIHGTAFTKGAQDSPVCTTCHGEHEIQAPKEPASFVYSANISKTTCPQCHNAERIIRKYGLPSDRIASYLDSYHGLADQFGDTTVANCASCHGIHNIYPSTNNRSLTHPDNLVKTCGKCHPGATANFSKGMIHGTIVKSKQLPELIKYYIRLFYLIIIPITILGMLLHNILDYAYRLRLKYRQQREEGGYERMGFSARIQHIVMLTSFIILVISGFALRLKLNFVFLSGEMNTLLRGTIHRSAAVIFIAISCYHIIYLFGKQRRSILFNMMPAVKDIRDIASAIGVYLGISKEFPKFGKYSYIEKSEYLAIIWGSIIMIATGLVLWFEGFFMKYIPKWGLDVADIIHYYEAILATLAIIVWHFYHVHIKPGASHTNLSWLTGKLTEEEMEEEHPLELEEKE